MRTRKRRISGLMLAFFGVVFMFSGFIAFALHQDSLVHEKRQTQAQSQVDSFDSGIVVEIYAYRTGSKPANYRFPQVVVLVNDQGDRLKVFVGKEVPLKGDRWNLRVSDNWNCDIMLNTLLEKGS